MSTPGTLKPGCAPARLLLELWQAQAQGYRRNILVGTSARTRLERLGLIAVSEPTRHRACWVLTQAGREAARVLEASS